jgi:superfamily II DNA/RNA helicase
MSKERRLSGTIRPDMYSIPRVADFIPSMRIPAKLLLSCIRNYRLKTDPIYKINKFNMNSVDKLAQYVLANKSQEDITRIKAISDELGLAVHQVIPLLYPREQKDIIIGAEVGTGKTRAAMARWMYMNMPKCMYITGPRLINEVFEDEVIKEKLESKIILCTGNKKEDKIRKWNNSTSGFMIVISKTDASKIISDTTSGVKMMIVDEADMILRTDLSAFEKFVDSMKTKPKYIVAMSGTTLAGTVNAPKQIMRLYNSEDYRIRHAANKIIIKSIGYTIDATVADGNIITKATRDRLYHSNVRNYDDETTHTDRSIELSNNSLTMIGYGSDHLSIPLFSVSHHLPQPWDEVANKAEAAEIAPDGTASAIMTTSTNHLFGNTYRFGITTKEEISPKIQIPGIMRKGNGGMIFHHERAWNSARRDQHITTNRTQLTEHIGFGIRLFKDQISLLSRFSKKTKRQFINIHYSTEELKHLINKSDVHWSAIKDTYRVMEESFKWMHKNVKSLKGQTRAFIRNIPVNQSLESGSRIYYYDLEEARDSAAKLTKVDSDEFVDKMVKLNIGREGDDIPLEFNHELSSQFHLGSPSVHRMPAKVNKAHFNRDPFLVYKNNNTDYVWSSDKLALMYAEMHPEEDHGEVSQHEERFAATEAIATKILKEKDVEQDILLIVKNRDTDVPVARGTTISDEVSTDNILYAGLFRYSKEKKIEATKFIDLTRELQLLRWMRGSGVIWSYMNVETKHRWRSPNRRGMHAISIMYAFIRAYYATSGHKPSKPKLEMIRNLVSTADKFPEFVRFLDIISMNEPIYSWELKFQAEKAAIMNNMYPTAVTEQELETNGLPTPRFDALVHLIEKQNNLPMIVFTKHPSVAKHLEEKLKERFDDVGIVGITAATKTGKERQKIKEANNDKFVIVTTTGVLQRGFNLGIARSVVIYETIPSSMSVIQSIGRIERPDANDDIRAYIFMDNTPWGQVLQDITRTELIKSNPDVDMSALIDAPLDTTTIERISSAIDEIGVTDYRIQYKRRVLEETFKNSLKSVLWVHEKVLEGK